MSLFYFKGWNILLKTLNPHQREAVKHFEGPALVLAGAGSGKTRVLAHRIAFLIENYGVSPDNILAVTFTNKAAREMHERVENLVRGGRKIWISTFHSACYRILRSVIKYAGYKENFSILDDKDQLVLIKKICADLNISEKIISPASIQSKINWCKNNMISPDNYLNSYGNVTPFTRKVGAVYEAYQEELKKSNLVDFGGLISLVVEIFNLNREVLDNYQKFVRFILVDEFQDTNYSQYALISLLGEKEKNVFVVGDEDQSIYGWRGATIENILNFEKDYKNAKVFRLEQNYRCTKTILNAANALISSNFERKGKKLWTENPEGESIKFSYTENEEEEAYFVAEKVNELDEEGFSLNDIAVFYRTNSQSRVFEEVFVRKGIPYSTYGSFKFYERTEVKNIVAYLKVLANPYDSLSLKRIINVPPRGIGSSSVEKIEEIAKNKNITFFEALKKSIDDESGLKKPVRKKLEDFLALLNRLTEALGNKKVSEVIRLTADESGYIAKLEEDGSEENKSRIENIEELVNASASFDYEGIERFLEHISLVTDADRIDPEKGTVSLMTLHIAKGLEFPVVFIGGMEEGLFPHLRSLDSRSELEEERRLCYVGMTRGKKKLFLSAARERTINGRKNLRIVSRFVKEIPGELIKFEKSKEFERGAGFSNYDNQVKGLLQFNSGDIVKHQYFGTGVVKEANSIKIGVLFDCGYKNLMIKYANLEKVGR